MTDQPTRREQIRRVLAEADGFAYECLEPHDYQRHADGILALPAASVATEDPACICGHLVRRHFEDVCQHCDCGDCMGPAAAMEVIQRLVRAVRQRRAELAESRAAILREATDAAEDVAIALLDRGDVERGNGAYDVVARLRRMAAPQPPAICELPHLTVAEEDACEQARQAHTEGEHCFCGPECATSGEEARPALNSWRVESYDPVAGEWVAGLPSVSRDAGAARLAHLNETQPVWRDGTPVRRRLVRTTTTHTVEET